ncbi:DUF6435 family protein [Aliidiomarina sp. Khilg15.8]
MFGLFKQDPAKKLRKQLALLQEKAMNAQRNGDIRQHSMLSQQADELWQEIQRIEAQ